MAAINSVGHSVIQQGYARLNNAGTQIAAFNGDQDLTNPLVGLKEGELQVAAGARVIEAEKSMLGSILDAFA